MVPERVKKYRSEIRKQIAMLGYYEHLDFPIADRNKVGIACYMERLITGDNLISRSIEDKKIVRVYRFPNDK